MTSRLSPQQVARQHHQAKSRAQAVPQTSATRDPGDSSVQPQGTPLSPGGEHPRFVLQPQIWKLAELRQVFRPIKNAVQTFSQQIYIEHLLERQRKMPQTYPCPPRTYVRWEGQTLGRQILHNKCLRCAGLWGPSWQDLIGPKNRIIPPFLDHAETCGITRALISDLGQRVLKPKIL